MTDSTTGGPYGGPPRGAAGRTTAQLLTDLYTELTGLFRKEIALVKTEMSEKVGQLAGGVAYAVAGGVLALVGVIFLLQALVYGIAYLFGIPEEIATLIVGLLVTGAGAFLVLSGVRAMKLDSLAPNRALRQVRKDAQVIKEKV